MLIYLRRLLLSSIVIGGLFFSALAFAQTPTTTYCADGSQVPSGTACPGMRVCPDGSQVNLTSSCPTTAPPAAPTADPAPPATSAPVPTYRCPDNSFANSAAECTRTTAPTPTIRCSDGSYAATEAACAQQATPLPTTLLCADGTRVATGTACPGMRVCPDGSQVISTSECATTVPTTTCSDGRRVTNAADCSSPKNGVLDCIKNNGLWCMESSSQAGFCSYTKSCRTATSTPTTALPSTSSTSTTQLDARSTQQINLDVKNLLRQVTSLEKSFTTAGDRDSLAKAVALRERLTSLVMDDTVYASLQTIRDEIAALLDIQQMNKQGTNTTEAQDERMQQRALKQLQQNVKTFSRQLTTIESKITKLERGGIKAPPRLKESVANCKILLQTIAKTKSYDEAAEAVDTLRTEAATLKELLPQLDKLTQLPRVLTLINREITKQQSTVKRLLAATRRLGEEAQNAINEVANQITAINSELADLKNNGFVDEDAADKLSALYDRLADTSAELQNLQALINTRTTLTSLRKNLDGFATRINKLTAAGQNMDEATALLNQMRDLLARLGQFGRVTAESVGELLDYINEAQDLSSRLDEILNASAANAVDKMLETAPSGGTTPRLEVRALEKAITNTYNIATLYRTERLQHNLAFGF